uniref:Uncharacterized protein n=1 Tax=Chrysemys picta bellii TaxID=8478 RepID=A0A8C3F7F9_CHRPI
MGDKNSPTGPQIIFSSIKQRHNMMHICRSLFSRGCAVQKKKSHIQLGFRSLMGKATFVQAEVTSPLAPSHSASSWAPRTRHEKKTAALSRKIATKELAKAAKILRKATMPRARNNHQYPQKVVKIPPKIKTVESKTKANFKSPKARAKKVALRKK